MHENAHTVNKLITHIELLLQSHDCVVIPGLGAILAHGLAPYYDAVQGRWMAPRRVMSFNPALSRTDGLIADSVARKEQIGKEVAASVVRRDVDKMRKILESEHKLELGAVGTLEMTSEGLLSFTPGICEWLSPGYMWLPSPSVALLPKASDVTHAYDIEIRRRRMPIILRRVAQIAACIAVMIGLGWVAARNLAFVSGEQLASIGPAHTDNAEVVSANADNTPIVVILAKAPADEVIENIPVKNIVKRLDNQSDLYYLVVGSFYTRDEAEKYISQHTEIPLGILAKDGRYRVYAASGTTSAQVYEAAKSEAISSRYLDSWVCRR